MQQFTSLEVLHVRCAHRFGFAHEEWRPTTMTRDQLYQILRSLPNPTLLRKFLIDLDLDGPRGDEKFEDLELLKALNEILGKDYVFQAMEDVSLMVWPLSKAPSQALIEKTMPQLHKRNIVHVRQ